MISTRTLSPEMEAQTRNDGINKSAGPEHLRYNLIIPSEVLLAWGYLLENKV